MSTITEQLAAALREIIRLSEETDELTELSAKEIIEALVNCEQTARSALAAFDTQPAADGDVVERVARALARKARVSEMNANGFNGIHLNEYVEMCWRNHIDRARAALAAMAAPTPADGLAELRVGDFVLRHAANSIWIGRTSGEGGKFATEHVERVIAQFYREQF